MNKHRAQRLILKIIKNDELSPSSRKICSNEKKEDLFKLYQQGMSVKKAAKILGVNVNTAQSTIRKKIMKGEIRARPPIICPITDAQREDVLKLYQQGNSIKAAARIAGVNENTAGTVIRKKKEKDKLGPCSIRKRRIITNELKEELVKLYQKENSIKAAAQIAGVNVNTADSIIRKKIKNGELHIMSAKTDKKSVEELVKLYQQGNTIGDAARIVGIKVSTARGIIKRKKQKGELRALPTE